MLCGVCAVGSNLGVSGRGVVFSLVGETSVGGTLSCVGGSDSGRRFIYRRRITTFLRRRGSISTRRMFLHGRGGRFVCVILEEFQGGRPVGCRVLVRIGCLRVSIRAITRRCNLAGDNIGGEVCGTGH